MILYDLQFKVNLFEFGIEIPIYDDKVSKTIEYFKNHTYLSKKFDEYSIKNLTVKLSRNDLLRVHSEEYINSLFSNKVDQEIIRSYELIDENGKFNRYSPSKAILPLSLIWENELNKAGGTLQCAQVALDKNFCFYFGGGSHHAQKSFGSGFCIINDIVIALRALQAEGKIESAWVIDVDAHKGDGTAALTYNDDTIRTLSIHMAKGWPLDSDEYIEGKFNPSFIPSDVDIPVEEGAESKYINELKDGLSKLDNFKKPEIALVVLGADPFEEDALPSANGIKLTLEQMLERDLIVYNFLKERKIPQAYVMAGGYGPKCWAVYSQFLEQVLNELS